MEYKVKNNGSYKIYNTDRLCKAIKNWLVFMDKSFLSTRKDHKQIFRFCIYKNWEIITSFYKVFGSNIFYKKLIQAINHKNDL